MSYNVIQSNTNNESIMIMASCVKQVAKSMLEIHSVSSLALGVDVAVTLHCVEKKVCLCCVI